MPYLHWETDRNRSRMAEVIDTKTDKHEGKARERKSKRKEDRQAKRQGNLSYEERQNPPRRRNQDDTRNPPERPCLPQIIHNRGTHYRLPGPPGDERYATPRKIGDVLWQAYKHNREERWEEKNSTGIEAPIRTVSVVRNPTGPKESRRIDPEASDLQNPSGTDVPRSGSQEANVQNETEPELPMGESCIGCLDSKTIPFPRIDDCRRLRPVHPLAQLLVDAARLYEEIMAFRDRRVHEGYLFHKNHLHPRRSLDQAYFWKIKSTRFRDRDQVVYRYTSAKFLHEFRVPWNEKTGKKIVRTLKDREARPNNRNCETCKTYARKMTGSEWTGHERYEDISGLSNRLSCQHCTEQIRKVPRAIMVDQLWMWILDESTILTCFPRRYGIGTDDPSGVHDSIRDRLSFEKYHNPSNHVISVFDLGLMILQECFDTLFDRTSTNDQRPPVLDMFGESIGRIVCLVLFILVPTV